ncbi:hypothetical protein MNB_SV-15-161 [hydrothermal vent metagenome]|uniref:Uncharacterized protein n=1 Tax=hydrothermal vent metagenome TaxID=652676 RepID=A0A1W1EL93_9ZZZZ
MKELVEILSKHNIICKKINKIDLKELNSRKKIDLYLGVTIKKFYCIVIYINRKSRVVTKDTKDYIELHHRLEEYNSSKILKKYIIIKSPICSKAEERLKDCGWRVIN